MEIDLQSLLIKAFLSVAPERSAVYVAGPLATGKRYYDALAAGESDDVRDANEAEMRDFIAALRETDTRSVIDPSLVRVAVWSPGDHGNFFLRLIETCCIEVVFMDGWEYSSGSAKEFVFASARGIQRSDRLGSAISIEQGLSLLHTACEDLKLRGLPTASIEKRLRELGSVA